MGRRTWDGGIEDTRRWDAECPNCGNVLTPPSAFSVTGTYVCWSCQYEATESEVEGPLD